MTDWARSVDFQRALIACQYYFGARGEALGEALASVPLRPAAADTLRGLSHAERTERARTLAAELARLSAALDERGLWR